MEVLCEEVYDGSIVAFAQSPVAEGSVKPVNGKSVFVSRFDGLGKTACQRFCGGAQVAVVFAREQQHPPVAQARD